VTQQDQVLRAVLRGYGTAPDIAKALGLDKRATSTYLIALERAGRIECTGMLGRTKVYLIPTRRAGHPCQRPRQSPS